MCCNSFKVLGVVLVLMLQLQLAGCGSNRINTAADATFPVVVFSDVHFNPFYDPSLFPALNAADASQWAGIFQTSSITAPSAWTQDTNYPLLARALSGIRQNLGASPLVVFTGDILGHYLPQTFYQLYDPANAQHPTAGDVAAMRTFTGKTVTFFMQQVRSAVGDVPVMFALGNADSYTGLGPDSLYLSNTAELYYTQFLNGTADHQTFLDTFTGGGYYSADMPGTNLVVIGLNTFEFSPPNPYMSDASVAVAAELAWLDSALASARARGKKVWLLMHVPPGADIGTTSQHLDGSGHITGATTTMMWNQDYQASFLRILSRYPGLITQTFAAHTHTDEYRIMSPDNVIAMTPAIAPYFGDNPAFRVFTFSRDTLRAIDYTTLNYDLGTMPTQFTAYYTFSTAFSMHGLVGDSLALLYPALVTDSTKQALYRSHYYSGRAYSVSAFNPITDTKWPLYWCGIGHMDQQGFIECVNSYSTTTAPSGP